MLEQMRCVRAMGAMMRTMWAVRTVMRAVTMLGSHARGGALELGLRGGQLLGQIEEDIGRNAEAGIHLVIEVWERLFVEGGLRRGRRG